MPDPRPINLVPGDTLRLRLAPPQSPGDPAFRLPDGTAIHIAGPSLLSLTARGQQAALGDGLNHLLLRRGPIRKRDIRALLAANPVTLREVDLTP